MPDLIGGLLTPQARNDVPTRCLCCPSPRRLEAFRNGPRTRIFVCPSSRAAIIQHDALPVLTTGQYTGSLDGV